MTTTRTILSLLALMAVGLVTLYSITKPNPIDMLVERSVPVPQNAKATNSEHGGTFAQYLFVRIELSENELARYRTALPDPTPLNVQSGIQIVDLDLSDSDMMELIKQGTEMRQKHAVNGGYLPWWKIDHIKNGSYHRQELENACAYEVYIDDDQSVVYIYWQYS